MRDVSWWGVVLGLLCVTCASEPPAGSSAVQTDLEPPIDIAWSGVKVLPAPDAVDTQTLEAPPAPDVLAELATALVGVADADRLIARASVSQLVTEKRIAPAITTFNFPLKVTTATLEIQHAYCGAPSDVVSLSFARGAHAPHLKVGEQRTFVLRRVGTEYTPIMGRQAVFVPDGDGWVRDYLQREYTEVDLATLCD